MSTNGERVLAARLLVEARKAARNDQEFMRRFERWKEEREQGDCKGHVVRA